MTQNRVDGFALFTDLPKAEHKKKGKKTSVKVNQE